EAAAAAVGKDQHRLTDRRHDGIVDPDLAYGRVLGRRRDSLLAILGERPGQRQHRADQPDERATRGSEISIPARPVRTLFDMITQNTPPPQVQVETNHQLEQNPLSHSGSYAQASSNLLLIGGRFHTEYLESSH